jgi:hypothetical protein
MQTECSAERFGFAAIEKRAVVAGLTADDHLGCRRADVELTDRRWPARAPSVRTSLSSESKGPATVHSAGCQTTPIR